MVIQHNLSAMNANRMNGLVTTTRAKSMEKLSSGYQVNRAADDAAGLSISEKMRRQIRGLRQGLDNIQDGVSACQIMDGSLTEVHDIMHRMTELSVKAANGTLNDEDRRAIQDEIDQLTSEIDRTTVNTKFNEKPLLSGLVNRGGTPNVRGVNKSDIVFLIDDTGSMGGHIRNVRNNLSNFADALSACDTRFGVVQYGELAETTTNTSYPFTESEQEVSAILGSILAHGGGDTPESALEAIMDGLNFDFRPDATKEFILVTDANYHCSDTGGDNRSALTSGDVKSAIEAAGARLSVVTSSPYMGLYQSSLANGKVLDINSNFYESLMSLAREIASSAGGSFYKNPEDIIIQMSGEVKDTVTIHTYNISCDTLELRDLTCLTQEEAQAGITRIKKASAHISSIRSQIGAEQNALEHAYKLRDNTMENATAAESRIRDTDMAKEMVKLSNHNILAQAGESMLAQANQTPQGVLSLLQ